MDIFQYIDRVKANFDKQPEPRYNMKKYFMGGLATPKRGLVDEPGSYSQESKTVGRNLLIKKFEESKEGQKIIKEFKEKTGKNYYDQAAGTRKNIREKKFQFATKVPGDDPTRFKEIKNFINNTKKTFGYFPTKAEINNYFLETKGTKYDKQVINFLKKTKIKLPSGMGKSKDFLNLRIKKLLNSKTITNILDAGGFPTNSIIKNVLKVDPTKAGSAAFELAKTLSGERKIRLFKAPTKYKKIAQKYLTENVGDIVSLNRSTAKERQYYERGLTKLLNLPKNIAAIRKDIVNKLKKIIPDMKNLSVDEIGGITSSMRSGSGPYAIFGQVIDKDFNSTKGSLIDAQKGILEQQLIKLNKNDAERLRLKTNYNEKVKQFEFDANKNNPIKKVKGLKLSFRPPSETVKNKKVYNQYKDLFDAHYNKYGYSFEVPADRDSIVDISKKLDNKAFQNTVKNRFTKLIGKGGKFGTLIGVGTLAGTGFALADQPDEVSLTKGTPESFPTKTTAGVGLTAGALGTKTGRDILGKTFKALDKGVLRPLTAIEAPLLAFPQSAYYVGDLIGDVKRGEQTDVKGMDITLPTSLSYAAASKNLGLDLFADKAGKVKRALRAGMTPQGIARLSKGSVFATPIIETAIQTYNAKKRLEDAKKKSSVFEERIPTLLGDAPKSYYDEIMSELPEVDRMGASSGGIASGPPPEKGPQSQGLAYLMKNGKR
tara:strand:- start:126 stop:2264 length:2139 start_codon:yes stop_codon:yes gene_type:complete